MTKYLFIFCVACVIGNSIVVAQATLYNKTFDDYKGWEAIINAFENGDSTIILSNQTLDFGASDSTYYRRLYFSLLDTKGNQNKRKLYTFENTQLTNISSFQNYNNNLTITAGFEDLDTSNKHKDLFKFMYLNNKTLDTLRTVNIKLHYPLIGNPGFYTPFKLSNGNFITCALFNHFIGDSIYIFGNDSNGNILWVKEYPQLHVEPQAVIEMPDNSVLLVGYQFTYSKYKYVDRVPIYIGHPERLWFAKIDSKGNLLWQHLYTGKGYEFYDTIYHRFELNYQARFRDAILTSDSNYVMGGCILNNPYLTKVNANGEKIWEHLYFMNSNKITKGFFINVKEINGNIYALGYADSLDVDSVEIEYIFLMKLSSTGKTIWTRNFSRGIDNYLYEITPSKSGIILTGSFQDTIPKYGSQDGWILKLDTNGCLFPGCHLNDVVDTLTSVDEMGKPKFECVIYPNPASSTLTIQTSQQVAQVQLWNITGALVYEQAVSNKTITIDISGITQGMYFIKLTNTQGTILQTHKVSIVH